MVVSGGLAVHGRGNARDEGLTVASLFGDEPEPPYERPPLTEDYLRGESRSKAMVHPASWYDSRRSTSLETCVTAIDRVSRS